MPTPSEIHQLSTWLSATSISTNHIGLEQATEAAPLQCQLSNVYSASLSKADGLSRSRQDIPDHGFIFCRYEDDLDEGEWFLYTGSGGRDLSGNKRVSKVRQGWTPDIVPSCLFSLLRCC